MVDKKLTKGLFATFVWKMVWYFLKYPLIIIMIIIVIIVVVIINWFHSLIVVGGASVILIGCMILLSPFLNVLRLSVSIYSFFPRIARLWNSLPAECFLLTYDQNGFMSGVNRKLLSLGSL